jgi:hypothetical protein
VKINKTALAAAASIAAVLVAGTAALAANFGILGAGDDIGEVASPSVVSTTSSTGAITSTTATDDTLVASSVAPPTAVETLAYQVEGVGVVTLGRSGDALDLLAVDADSQWSWIREPAGDGVTLRFTSGSSMIAFSAFVDQGRVLVDVVDETPVPATTSNPSVDDDDHDEDDGHDEDDDRDDDHDDDRDEDHDDD